MRYRVLPYRQGSKGAKALATALGGKVLRLEGSTFRAKEDDLIINWGNTHTNDQMMYGDAAPVLNDGDLIRGVSNKLSFFRLMTEKGLQDVIPLYWTNPEEIPSEAFPVVCRTVLAGHSGDGIVIAGDRSELVSAPLYVMYQKKKDEYRVHCGSKTDSTPDPFSGGSYASAIAVQRKARRQDHENPNWQVRNLANGFVYVRNDVNPPASVVEVALQAFGATGLVFGAVDVIWNQEKQRAFVLEINTAPGLEGQTIEDYAAFFRNM
jgi:glutathione synthase/RimK-type ligase-like ATP-grasp enzyme